MCAFQAKDFVLEKRNFVLVCQARAVEKGDREELMEGRGLEKPITLPAFLYPNFGLTPM